MFKGGVTMGMDIKPSPFTLASDLVGNSYSTHSKQLEITGFNQEE